MNHLNPFKLLRFLLSKESNEVLYTGLANIVSSILGGIFYLILATIIDASIYGEIGYYLSIAPIASALSMLGFNISSITFTAKNEKEIFTESLTLVIITSSIAAIVVTILLSNITLALLIIGMNLFGMNVAEMIGKREYKKRFIFVSIARSLQFILSISLYFIFGIEGVILGYAFPSLILSMLIFKKYRINDLRLKHIKKKLRFITSVYLSQISSSITLYADKLIIAHLFGFEIVGLYLFATQIFLFLSAIVVTTIVQYLHPYEAKNINKKIAKLIFIISSITITSIFFLALPFLVEAFFPRYIDAIDAARIMVLGLIPSSIGSAIIGSKALGREENDIILLGMIVHLGSMITLLILLGMFGLIGLASAWTLSIVIRFIVVIIYVRYFKHVNITL